MAEQNASIEVTRKELKALQQKERENPRRKKLHCLLLGDKGAGKTTFLATAPRPILIHSFDPGGTESIQDFIDAGGVFVDTQFERDNLQHPTAYLAWEREFNRLGHSGLFENIGTYAIDSLTTFSTAATFRAAATLRAAATIGLALNCGSNRIEWRLDGNQGTIQTSRLKTMEVDRDESKAERAKLAGQLAITVQRQQTPQVVLRDLDPSQLIGVQTNPDLSKPLLSQQTFGLFDASQPIDRYLRPVGNATGQTRCCGKIMIRQSEISGNLADHLLAPSQFRQRGQHPVIAPRLDPRPIITQVLSVGPRGDLDRGTLDGVAARPEPLASQP